MKAKALDLSIQLDGKDVFVKLADGTKIAKRGRPGTPEAGTWISLHPNYVVTSPPDLSEIEIVYTADAGHD
jgi:hypothetical protein